MKIPTIERWNTLVKPSFFKGDSKRDCNEPFIVAGDDKQVC